MKVYKNISEFKKPGFAVVTVGTFDGIHSGHKKVFNILTETAKTHNGESIVWTFNPPPRQVLSPASNDIRCLNTLDEKISLIREAGVDHLILFRFTKEFSLLTPEQFISEYLVKVAGARIVIVGHDHMFGKGGLGSFETLTSLGKDLNFEVLRLEPEKIDGEVASSSRIRDLLLNGKIPEATHMLGYYYSLKGHVVYGQRLGKTIGFPTANVEVTDACKLIPARGVYAVMIKVTGSWEQDAGKWEPDIVSTFRGMCNIGTRPTFGGVTESIEVNIFDFDANLYGQEITVEFAERIRDEQKFEGVEQLKAQLFRDRERAMELLG